jgi:hypothetical protein
MKKIHRLSVVVGTLVFGATSASATHSWNGYHWARTHNPLVLKVNGSLTGVWPDYVNLAMANWSNFSSTSYTDVLDFSPTVFAPSSASVKKCSPIAGQDLVCNAPYGQRGWLGVASVWLSGSHITQGTVKLNDTYFAMAQYNTPSWRQMVTCQEIGHTFGLDHQDTNFNNTNLGTCMDYTNDPTGTAGTNGTLANTAPNAHDYEELDTIYQHLDSTNTATLGAAVTNFGIRMVGKPVPQADEGVGDTMADWGRAVHFDGKGRPDKFVRQLLDGRRIATHVLWALDATGNEAR